MTFQEYIDSHETLTLEAAAERLGMFPADFDGAESVEVFAGFDWALRLPGAHFWAIVERSEYTAETLEEIAATLYREWYLVNHPEERAEAEALETLERVARVEIDSDVAALRFYESVAAYLGFGFHPDDSFSGLVNRETGARTFDADMADRLDRRNAEACEMLLDQYEAGMALMGHDSEAADRETVPACLATFPDFDGAAIVRLLESYLPGFRDISYKNDACPSLAWEAATETAAETGVRVWVDYADPEARENGSLVKRYGVDRIDANGEPVDSVATDSVAEAIEAARRFRAEIEAESLPVETADRETVPACLAAFPDYDSAETVRLLESSLPGFEDSSWHNDACPKIEWINPEDPERGVCVWCDYADPAEREHSGGTRFCVVRLEDWDCIGQVCTDSVAEAIEAARRMQSDPDGGAAEPVETERKAGDAQSRAAAREALERVAAGLGGLDLDAIADAIADAAEPGETWRTRVTLESMRRELLREADAIQPGGIPRRTASELAMLRLVKLDRAEALRVALEALAERKAD